MGRKQRREVSERLAAIPDSEQRLIIAKGCALEIPGRRNLGPRRVR
jgi:hypothetical protein